MAVQRQERDTSSGQHRGKTPDKWDGPVDEKQDGGDYPNYTVHKDRSGNVTMISKTKENEFVAIQHRAGQKITFKPDGAIEIVSHRGRYDITFGENRVRISGSNDVTVKNDSSMKTDGQRTETTYQDTQVAGGGDYVASHQSENKVIAENSDMVCGSCTMAASGGMTFAAQGQGSFTFGGGMTMGSSGGKGDTSIGSSKHLAMASGQETAIKAGTKASIMTKSGDIAMDSSSGKIYLNSGQSTDGATLPSNAPTSADARESRSTSYNV